MISDVIGRIKRLHDPATTRKALVALYVVCLAQLTAFVGAKPVLHTLFDPLVTSAVVDKIVQQAQYVATWFSVLPVILGSICAFGRSIATAIDNSTVAPDHATSGAGAATTAGVVRPL